MTSDSGYNGWSNYETWVVRLWIDNAQGTQEYWRERTEDFALAHRNERASSVLTPKERAIQDLAGALKSDHEENAPELTGVFADLLNAALGEVDWYEIAESMLDRGRELGGKMSALRYAQIAAQEAQGVTF